MKYGTFCSGAEAPTVAWDGLGWKPVFFSEIEPFPCAVLKHHYPTVPNIGDMNHAQNNPIFQDAAVDLICAGTPCQSFSLAGLRAGMACPNGNLALQFLRLLDQKRPRWMVWENVPGVLSSWSDAADGPTVDGIGPENRRNIEQTNDFDTFIAGLTEIGYGVAWRILDAQYFGVPQRRRRVFVVGYLGNWRRAAAALFDRQSMCGNNPARGQAGPGSAVGALTGASGGLDDNDARPGHLVMSTGQASAEINFGQSRTLTKNHEAPIVFNLRGRDAGNVPEIQKDGLASLRAASGGSTHTFFAFQSKASASQSMNPGPIFPTMDVGKSDGLAFVNIAPTLTKGSHNQGPGGTPDSAETIVRTGGRIRRLTPRECERLQGFPDDYSNIIYRKKPAADGPRYAIMGNSMAVPCMLWLGQRIDQVDKIKNL